VTPASPVASLAARAGGALFLLGIFVMLAGDWPRPTLLPFRVEMPLSFLAWPWLYLVLLVLSLGLLVSSGALSWGRPAAADVLCTPLAWLGAAFFLSMTLSQVPELSEWAFGCFLAIAAFTLAAGRIAEVEACARGIGVAITAAAVLLAVRVIIWRFDEGLAIPAYHVRNNAWLGKIQITWVLSLLAPFLLTRYLEARGKAALCGHGVAWLLTAAAVYVLFSRMGVVTFPLVTLGICALNWHAWRRWLSLLALGLALAIGLVAVNPRLISGHLVGALVEPQRDASVVDRQDILRRTVRMIADHPLVGIGLGTYDDVVYSQYGHTTAQRFFRRGLHAHNTPLHILTETGVLGFLAWCYLWFAVGRYLLRRVRDGGHLGRLRASAPSACCCRG
jgi:O-antigen ligase